jgi:hypothetical protein
VITRQRPQSRRPHVERALLLDARGLMGGRRRTVRTVSRCRAISIGSRRLVEAEGYTVVRSPRTVLRSGTAPTPRWCPVDALDGFGVRCSQECTATPLATLGCIWIRIDREAEYFAIGDLR